MLPKLGRLWWFCLGWVWLMVRMSLDSATQDWVPVHDLESLEIPMGNGEWVLFW